MKKILIAISLTMVSITCFAMAKDGPLPLETGDLIFQTSKTRLSAVTATTTGSSLTHVGMILKKKNLPSQNQ